MDGTEEFEAFAQRVQELLELLHNGAGEEEWLRAPDDVKRVASGLHMLRSLVKRELKGIGMKAEEDQSRVLVDLLNAAALLNALRTGWDHPIWVFIRGMQKGNRRAKAPPNSFNVWKRAAILAYIDVLKSEGQRNHVKFAVDQLTKGGVPLSIATIQGWQYRSNGSQADYTRKCVTLTYKWAEAGNEKHSICAFELVQSIWRDLKYPDYLKS
jgi:hypothetical protein